MFFYKSTVLKFDVCKAANDKSKPIGNKIVGQISSYPGPQRPSRTFVSTRFGTLYSNTVSRAANRTEIFSNSDTDMNKIR